MVADRVDKLTTNNAVFFLCSFGPSDKVPV